MKNILFVLILSLLPLISMANINNNDNSNSLISNYSKIEKDGSVSLIKQSKHNDYDFEQSKNFSKSFSSKIGKNISTTPITDDNVEYICKKFIANSSSHISIENLKLISAKLRKNQWYVNFLQTSNGIPLINAITKLRIHKNGNLIDIDAKYYDVQLPDFFVINNDTNAVKAAAITALQSDMPVSQHNFQFTFGEQYILPVPIGKIYIFRLVQQIEFRNSAGNISYMAYVDIETYKLIQRHNQLHNAEYKFQSKVVETEPSVPLVETSYFPYIEVEIDGKSYFADEQGVITTDDDLNGKTSICNFNTNPATYPKILTLFENWNMIGGNNTPYPFDGSNVISNNIIQNNDNELLNRIVATHSTSFYKMNKRFTDIDPDFDYLGREYYGQTGYTFIYLFIPEDSPYAEIMVNASSNFNRITFYQPLDSKMRIGQMPSVMYHELGHSINSFIYKDAGKDDMINLALHEGTADVHTAIMLGYQDVFRGLSDNGESTESDRFLKNNLKLYVDDIINPEGHYAGQIISGALWDFAELTSMELMADLFHYTRFYTPDGETIPQAFTQWLVAMLQTDDDDGVLSNGTPHFNEIITAFDNHNITLDYFMKANYQHIPLEDTPDTLNGYELSLIIPTVNAFKPIDEVWLHYSVGNKNDSVIMSRENDIYTSMLPAQNKGTIVSYYFKVNSPFSNSFLSLDNETDSKFTFLVGFDTVYFDNSTQTNEHKFISDNQANWSKKLIEYHNANYAPQADHSGDNYCWAIVSAQQSGNNRLISAQIDFPEIITPNNTKTDYLISLYYCNFVDDLSAMGWYNSASLDFAISIDGGTTYKPLKSITENCQKSETNLQWQRLIFRVKDYFTDFNKITISATAKGETMVEIAAYITQAFYIDDVTLLINDTKNDIEEQNSLANPTLYPNPAELLTNISFDLLEATNIRIVLSDILGQELVKVYEGFVDAGHFNYAINTSNLSQGVYFVKMNIGEKFRVEKVVIK